MKKIALKNRLLPLSLTLLLAALSLTGCKKPQVEVTTPHTIVTSFYPMYIMALNIADSVPGVTVVNMTKPQTGCLHDYQLTPNDMITLEKASMFIANGAGMESFLEKVLASHPSMPILTATTNIPLLYSESIHDSHDHHDTHNEHDAINKSPNGHVWVSITHAKSQVRTIAKGLAAWDTAHANRYQLNSERYIQQLDSLGGALHQMLDTVKSRKIITFHEAFDYFAQEFNLEIVASVEREPGSQPSAGELADIIKLVKNNNVQGLFAEPQYPAKSAQIIADETGLPLKSLDPAVTGPFSKTAYLDIMRKNGETLLKALR